MTHPAPTPDPSSDQGAGLDLRNFIRWIEQDFAPSVRRGEREGNYARHPQDAEIELYGVCDMASVLYSIDRLSLDQDSREDWSAAIATFQTGKDGWFCENAPTHATIHNTAFALSTLELLGLKPKQSVDIPSIYSDAGVYLHTLDWKRKAYSESHFGAGIGSICMLVD